MFFFLSFHDTLATLKIGDTCPRPCRLESTVQGVGYGDEFSESEEGDEEDEEDRNNVLENIKNKGMLRRMRKRARVSSPTSTRYSLSPPPASRPASPSPRVRSRRKTWKCNVCGKSFPSMTRRNEHQESSSCKDWGF